MDKLRKITFKSGAYIYVEGDEDTEEIYILEKGEVELHTNSEKIKNFKPTIRTGEIFGFSSSLCRRPRMESAIARKDSTVLVIMRDSFIHMIQQNPSIAMKIISYFAEELHAYNEMLCSVEDDESTFLSDETRLYHLGKYYYEKGELENAHYILEQYRKDYPGESNISRVNALLDELNITGNRESRNATTNGIYRKYYDQQMVFSEHEKAEELYIVKEGKIKIIKVFNGQEVLLSVLQDGEIFGELAIVSNRPRNATAISWGETLLLPIKKESLSSLLEKSPEIIHKIFMAISQRIWFTYIRLESRLYASPATRIYVFMENKLLENRISLKSTKPITLYFGINELLRMNGIPSFQKEKTIDLLLSDTNLNFNFGHITIENPSNLSSRAKFHRSRDHINYESGKDNQTKQHVKTTISSQSELQKPEHAPDSDKTMGLKPADLRVSSEDIPMDLDS